MSTEKSALKAEARQRWEQDRAWLLVHQPFVARLAMNLNIVPVVDYRVPTACTDGRQVFVNPEWLRGMSRSDGRFVLAHEVWHCAAGHLWRRGGRLPTAWNLAVDHEVNGLLMDQGFQSPEGAVYFPEMSGCSAETVYAWLMEQDPLPDQQPLDNHGCPLGQPGDQGPVDPDYQPDHDREIETDWEGYLLDVASQLPGEIPAGMEQRVGALGQSRVPWQAVLRRFVTRSFDRQFRWTPPNRRMLTQGFYLPGQRGERLDIAVAVDTSGSTASLMPDFLAELEAILDGFGRYRLRLLTCDAAIHSDEVIEDGQPLPDLDRLRGGGGTDFRPVFERLSAEPPQALVFLTDGFGPAPNERPAWPTLWVTDEGGVQPVDWGEWVRINQ